MVVRYSKLLAIAVKSNKNCFDFLKELIPRLKTAFPLAYTECFIIIACFSNIRTRSHTRSHTYKNLLFRPPARLCGYLRFRESHERLNTDSYSGQPLFYIVTSTNWDVLKLKSWRLAFATTPSLNVILPMRRLCCPNKSYTQEYRMPRNCDST